MKNPDHSPSAPDNSPPPFDAFRDLTERLIQVPKAEVDEKEAEYQREQAKKPKRGPKKAG